jgi:hypothetical protein
LISKSRDVGETICILKRYHPTGVFRRESADLIQLLHFFIRKLNVDCGQILLELLRTLGANDDGGYERLCQDPRQGYGGHAGVVRLGNGAQHIQNAPGALFVHDGKVEGGAA